MAPSEEEITTPVEELTGILSKNEDIIQTLDLKLSLEGIAPFNS